MGNRRTLGYIAIGFVVFAAAGLGISYFLLTRWSQLQAASPTEADDAFAGVVSRFGGGPAYLQLLETGQVVVRRDLEQPEPVGLRSLHLLAWEPNGAHLLRVDFPFWFVRLKMSDTLNLGTLTSALAGDWEDLDLRVSEQDLERRGPGIVLDHRLADGKRLLLWTE